MSERLFFACKPDLRTAHKLRQIACRHALSDDRPIPTDNLHLTLAFLGNCNESQTNALIQASELVTNPSFSLRFSELGYWRKPKVLVALPNAVPDELQNLVDSLNLVAKAQKIELDPRPYCPHITLSRKQSKAPLAMAMNTVQIFFGAFYLYRSISTSKDGVRYQALRHWPLI